MHVIISVYLPQTFQLTEKDVYLSYLPLAHIFDRVIEELFISEGAAIGFWRGVHFKYLSYLKSHHIFHSYLLISPCICQPIGCQVTNRRHIRA